MVRLAKNKYINVFLGIKLKNKKKTKHRNKKKAFVFFSLLKKMKTKKKTCFFHIGFVLPQNKLMNE